MVKKLFLSLGLASLLVSGSMACEAEGCTPGFWKTGNHIIGFQSLGYAVEFELDADASVKVNAMIGNVNGKAYNKLSGMNATPEAEEVLELGEALWLKGNKDDTEGDKFLQLVRTSTAALLNIREGLDYIVPGYGRMDEDGLKEWVQWALGGSLHDIDYYQGLLDDANNEGCPF